MHDRVDWLLGEHLLDAMFVEEIDLMEAEVARVQLAHPVQCYGATIREVIHNDDIPSGSQQLDACVASDVAGTARHKDRSHAACSSALLLGRPHV